MTAYPHETPELQCCDSCCIFFSYDMIFNFHLLKNGIFVHFNVHHQHEQVLSKHAQVNIYLPFLIQIPMTYNSFCISPTRVMFTPVASISTGLFLSFCYLRNHFESSTQTFGRARAYTDTKTHTEIWRNRLLILVAP